MARLRNYADLYGAIRHCGPPEIGGEDVKAARVAARRSYYGQKGRSEEGSDFRSRVDNNSAIPEQLPKLDLFERQRRWSVGAHQRRELRRRRRGRRKEGATGGSRPPVVHHDRVSIGQNAVPPSCREEEDISGLETDAGPRRRGGLLSADMPKRGALRRAIQELRCKDPKLLAPAQDKHQAVKVIAVHITSIRRGGVEEDRPHHFCW